MIILFPLYTNYEQTVINQQTEIVTEQKRFDLNEIIHFL